MAGPDELAGQLGAISARLKEIGETGLARELSRGVGKAVGPIPKRIRAAMPDYLPNRYAETLDEDTSIRRRTINDEWGAKVTVYATNKSARRRKLNRLDQGILWHPLFGRFPRRDPRNRWYEQAVPKGWFTGVAEKSLPEARSQITDAMNTVTRKAVGE